MTGRRAWVNACALAVVAGCGDGEPAPGRSSREAPIREEAARAAIPESAPERGAPAWPIERAGDLRARAGSTVVIGTIAEGGPRGVKSARRRLLFVADADEKVVRAIDPARRVELASSSAGGSPSSLLVGPDGRLYAALRDRGSIAVLESTGRGDGSLAVVASWKTAAEPVALALSVDGSSLLSVSGWGHALSSFPLDAAGRSFTVGLGREPRAVLPSEDGRTVFVSHANVGQISAIDLDDEGAPGSGEAGPGEVALAASPEARGSYSSENYRSLPRVRAIPLDGGDTAPPEHCAVPMLVNPPASPAETRRSAVQGYALASVGGAVLASMVLVRSGNPSVRGDGYGGSMEDLPSEISTLAVIERRGHVRRSSTHVQSATVAEHLRTRKDCLLPRAMVADEASRSVLVVCQGIDAVLDLPADAPDPARAERRRFLVDGGPTGIAIDPEEREAYVLAQLDRTVTVLALGAPRTTANITATPGRGARIPLSAASDDDGELALGRALFHRTGDPRIARDGRGCASCHPDGRDDGLVWSTPEGPRQAPMLAGRTQGTAPYGWSSRHATIADHLAVTFARLGGKGLAAPELAALTLYVDRMPGPAREAGAAPETIARGREVFLSDDVGCARCHREETAWSDGDVHDILSAHAADRSPKLDTPSLRFVGGTAPYFHDGRFATLADVLARTDGLMGSTGQLDERDRSALIAYLESL